MIEKRKSCCCYYFIFFHILLSWTALIRRKRSFCCARSLIIIVYSTVVIIIVMILFSSFCLFKTHFCLGPSSLFFFSLFPSNRFCLSISHRNSHGFCANTQSMCNRNTQQRRLFDIEKFEDNHKIKKKTNDFYEIYTQRKRHSKQTE